MTMTTAASATQMTIEINGNPAVGWAALSQMSHAVVRRAAHPRKKTHFGNLGVSLGRFMVSAVEFLCCVGLGISTRKQEIRAASLRNAPRWPRPAGPIPED